MNGQQVRILLFQFSSMIHGEGLRARVYLSNAPEESQHARLRSSLQLIWGVMWLDVPEDWHLLTIDIRPRASAVRQQAIGVWLARDVVADRTTFAIPGEHRLVRGRDRDEVPH